jgi:hypothetical protein
MTAANKPASSKVNQDQAENSGEKQCDIPPINQNCDMNDRKEIGSDKEVESIKTAQLRLCCRHDTSDFSFIYR